MHLLASNASTVALMNCAVVAVCLARYPILMAPRSEDLAWPDTAGPNKLMLQQHDRDLLQAEFRRGGLPT